MYFCCTKEHLYAFPENMKEEILKHILESDYSDKKYYEVGKPKTIKTDEI